MFHEFQNNYYKVWQKLLQSVTGITKWDRIYYKVVAGVTKCDKMMLQGVTDIAKYELQNEA